MDRETRLQLILDHHRRPRHRGALPDPDAVVPGGNRGCGDVITLYLKADPAGAQVAQVSFEGEGCTVSQAAASMLADKFNREHPTFEEVLEFSYEQMLDYLGRDVVGSRPLCATLALGTAKAAVKTVQINRQLRAAGKTDEQIRALRAALAEQAAGSGLVFGEAAAAAAGPRPHDGGQEEA